jgi:hypothetical protein
MSGIQFGLPLAKPSKQVVLPIVLTSGKVVGFFPIAETTFAGTETSFTLADGAVPITTVTLPPKNNTGTYDENRVQQYMAAQWPEVQDSARPWIGYTELVSADVPNTIGFYSWWSMPTVMWFHHFGRGSYLQAMKFNLDKYVTAPASSTSPPVVTTPQTLAWATSMNAVAFATSCSFFDFNWTDLFKTQFVDDPSQAGNTVIPLTISVVSNPAGGYFKASTVSAQGSQTIVPGGGVQFNTIRILRLQDPPPATYTFNFLISATVNGVVQSVPAVLNLVVT